jgi:hypothetical protein
MAELSKQGQEAVSQAQDQAVKLVGMAREQATTQVTTQKARAAGMLGALGTALQDTSRQVREQDETALADYIETTAEQIEQLATMLKEQEIGQLLDSVQQFARRQPILFAAAAIGVGFVATRFLKSSSPSEGTQNGSAGSWATGTSPRSDMGADDEVRSSRMRSSGFGTALAADGPGAERA